MATHSGIPDGSKPLSEAFQPEPPDNRLTENDHYPADD